MTKNRKKVKKGAFDAWQCTLIFIDVHNQIITIEYRQKHREVWTSSLWFLQSFHRKPQTKNICIR